jgi:hypothetical protein
MLALDDAFCWIHRGVANGAEANDTDGFHIDSLLLIGKKASQELESISRLLFFNAFLSLLMVLIAATPINMAQIIKAPSNQSNE